MHIHNTSVGPLLRANNIQSVPGVVHGFGVRGLDVGAYLDALGMKNHFIFATNQIHGDVVHYLKQSKARKTIEGDAFITDRRGTVCFVRSADCVPMLIADTEHPAVAAVHAGWRGTTKDVAGVVVRAMHETFGTLPQNCVAAIGPRICGSCYEVGGEVIDAFSMLKLCGTNWRTDYNRVDLGLVNQKLLERAGLLVSNISVFPHCTACDKAFSSWRRDRNESERQFNFIVITPP